MGHNLHTGSRVTRLGGPGGPGGSGGRGVGSGGTGIPIVRAVIRPNPECTVSGVPLLRTQVSAHTEHLPRVIRATPTTMVKHAYNLSADDWLTFQPQNTTTECQVVLQQRQERPENTERGYNQWQREFLHWQSQSNENGLVTPERCAKFVLMYEQRAKNDTTVAFGKDQVQKLTSALGDLYKLQRLLLNNELQLAKPSQIPQVKARLSTLKDPNTDGLLNALKDRILRQKVHIFYACVCVCVCLRVRVRVCVRVCVYVCVCVGVGGWCGWVWV